MPRTLNLAGLMEKQLPQELVEFLEAGGLMAASQGQGLYLVGGVVRDLLLGRTNLDLDVVVEGDALSLASRLAGVVPAKVVSHSRFGTATLRWGKWRADLVTARAETYSKPGALPAVRPASLAADLLRRDFTINAMAVELTPPRWGRLVDLYGGCADLKRNLIRILHDRSFIDDATRIWRAIRYEQRLGFRLEEETEELLRRDVAMLDTISGDRIRHELELVVKEELPEKVLARAEELGVLARLHPALKGNGWLAKRFQQARRMSAPAVPPPVLYLALLTYPMTAEEREKLISYLRLSRQVAQVLRDTGNLGDRLELLDDSRLAPSVVYHLVHGYSLPAVTANLLAADSPVVRRRIRSFLTRLRYVRPSLSGDDLRRMGVSNGPQIRAMLETLLEARLDGKARSRDDEEEMVRGWARSWSREGR